MYRGRIVLSFVTFIFHLVSCDWAAEWMAPVQDQLKENPSRRINDYGGVLFDDETLHMVQVEESTEHLQSQMMKKYVTSNPTNTELTTSSLKIKLENTLMNARKLADTLKAQIKEVSEREEMLKDAIVNGRSGVSSVVVSTLDRAPRAYVIQDGVWTFCRGSVRPQRSAMAFEDFSSVPKCFGQEMSAQQDPCVFNSIIKYETMPTVRRLEYSEDDFLCLKKTFNNTLERYLSVPRQIINKTCQNGTVRSLEENTEKCGLRVMSEYTYYPSRNSPLRLPLEYCAEPDGSCKLIMAWHVSNSTIENFEFLKNEQGFKKYFIKSGSYVEHVM
ncbi:uncharacterized protein LOC114361932 [Ostrinia furnacalis]|uniref:uncharacterized protein LOC114361932 n=1 Tax=Ostrinia furnacalis TaxID=93504 RepID=UPI00103A0EFE|nr:uncharacterized protein LOC114361932 [Ostrinia furnacalis]